jgi:hypothetical protein
VTTTNRIAPDPKTEGVPSVLQAHSHDTAPVPVPRLTEAEICASRPLYVLITKTPSERITRRVYLSLHSATKAVQRAQARGNAASLELCRCVPYTVGSEIRGGGQHE